MNKKKMMLALTACALLLSAAGCGKDEEKAGSGKYPGGEVSYPIECSETVSFWVGINSIVSKFASTAGDTEYAKHINEATGINVEFIHPPAGQEETKFNLLLASGSMPDIVSWDWMNISDNIDDLIEQGYILKLNGFMEEYAPNMTKYIKSVDGLEKMLQTDSGNFYVFPYIRDTDDVRVFCGPVIRKDWLDELGLEVPETIDEWHEMLVKFKEAKGIAPLLTNQSTFMDNGMFLGAYGTKKGMYVNDGKVVYGPATEEYKQAILTLAQWNKEGLINQNFISIDTPTINSKMLNDEIGATYGYNASGLGTWLANGSSNGNFDLVAAKYPSLVKGQKSAIGQKNPLVGEFFDCIISGTSTNKELAARLLDFNFTEEGHMIQHFGEEGKTYTINNGVPTFTDFVLNNPDGRSMSEVLTDYTHTTYSIPGYSNSEAFKQQLTYPQQIDALEKWSDTDADKHQLPPLSMSKENIDEYNKIMTDVKTFVDETTIEFIMGAKSEADFDKYFTDLKDMGIDRAVGIEQTAYDRFQSR
ncbi:MAG: extracellular solute-binding protein [Clostridia bacterium]|nr:extracellular solute-binding protein [Clostridia bacterium]